jgi:hypothetical protein
MTPLRFYFILLLLTFAMPAHGFNYPGTLTISECKACKSWQHESLIRERKCSTTAPFSSRSRLGRREQGHARSVQLPEEVASEMAKEYSSS